MGWAWNKWLFYGSGGGAQGTVDTQLVNATGVAFDHTNRPTYRGWYAGFGAEYVLAQSGFVDVIGGLEYQHIDLGTQYNASSADNFSPSPPGVNGRNVALKDDLVRVRVSLKINPLSR